MKILLIMVLFIVLNFESNMCRATVSIEAEYNSVKYIELSMMEALTDINYIIGVNEVTSQIKELQDETPIKILAQEGYETTKLTNVMYVLDFEVINKDKVKISYQVLMKVNPLNGKVVIDSFKQKEFTTTVNEPITSSSTTNNTTKPTTPIPETELIKKTNYINIGVDTINKGDLYLLIFLDNVNKTIEKALQQIGVKSTKNDILYIGRLDGSDLIYYWVEVRILVDNLEKVLRVRGSEHKVTYEVKMIELVEDKSSITNNNTNTTTINNTTSSNTNSNNVSNSNSSSTSNNTSSSNQSSQATVQIKDNKETLTVNSSTNINTSTPINITPSANTTPTQSSSPPEPYNSPIYQQLNQTLIIKSSGYEELESKLFTKDEPLIIVTEKFLNSRPNKSTIKIYKAFVKNYALKAEYKMFFIDEVIDAPNIIVYEGFATYDFLKKRVYVISFGQILY